MSLMVAVLANHSAVLIPSAWAKGVRQGPFSPTLEAVTIGETSSRLVSVALAAIMSILGRIGSLEIHASIKVAQGNTLSSPSFEQLY